MPFTTNDFGQIAARHVARFAAMDTARTQVVKSAQAELLNEVVRLHSGQPSGASRLFALYRADHPFARRHGAPLWATPPIGIVSGALLASLAVKNTQKGSRYSLTAVSVGIDYAKYLYSPSGTRNMLPRGVIAAANTFAEMGSIKMGSYLMAYQKRMI